MKKEMVFLAAMSVLLLTLGCSKEAHKDTTAAVQQATPNGANVQVQQVDDGKGNVVKYMEALHAGDVNAAFQATGALDLIQKDCNNQSADELKSLKDAKINKCVENTVKEHMERIEYNMKNILPKSATYEYLESRLENYANVHYFKITYASPQESGGLWADKAKVVIAPIAWWPKGAGDKYIEADAGSMRPIERWSEKK